MTTDLIPAEVEPVQASALTDLRSMAMAVPTEVIQRALSEYVDKRNTLRDWLLAQMKEGIHYGVPPGCEPKGNVNEKQWKHKPSLYKAGAELVIDLMGLRQEYEPDLIGWQQLGSEKGTAVYKCRLVSRSTGAEVGQGIGAGKVGRKGADENKAVKDAQKRAMVAAVLNAYGLSDLYVADLEDYVPPENENPEQRAKPPYAPSREQRRQPPPESETAIEAKRVMGEWFKQFGDESLSREQNIAAMWRWFSKATGSQTTPAGPADWSAGELAACRRALGIPNDADLGVK
jgi:hypothetical protein